jgi:DNA-directed RNA polymerase
MANLLKTIGIEKPQRRTMKSTTGITREELLKALRGEVELPPEFDPALPAQTRRRAKLKAMKAKTGEEVAEDEAETETENEDDEASDVFEDDEDEMDSVKAAAIAEAEQIFQERFIDLVQLLPPLPQKGQFDVTNIKRSQYFFS